MTSLKWRLKYKWDEFTHWVWNTRRLFARKYAESIWHFSGEFFREGSVLVLVFGFLEKANKEGRVEYAYGRNICLVTLLAFVGGMYCWQRSEKAKKAKNGSNKK